MFFGIIATSLPPNVWSQAECWHLLKDTAPLRALNSRSHSLLEKVLLGNSGIETRHFATNRLEDILLRDAQQLNESFEREATLLGADALRKLLARASLSSVDALFVCTCTAQLCPGLSSHIAEAVDLPAKTFLLDNTGSGCGAAIPSIRAACHYLRENPTHRVAVVAVEVCSSAFYVSDDPGVLISLCLFGDGAAAVLLEGEEVRRSDRHFGAFDTLHLPEHREKIRFVNRDGRLCNQLHRSVPEVAAQAVRTLHDRLPGNGVGARRVLSHGGGRDVLAAVQTMLPGQDLHEAYDVFRTCGNMSSPSVLFALEKHLLEGPASPIWLTSFGAGFAAHSCTL